MMRENPISKRVQGPDAMPVVPADAFFQTVAGPGETAYPAEGESNVYYGQRLKNVGFVESIGTTALSSTGTGKYAYFYNLSTDDYIEEGSKVWCFKRNGQWFTIDKVKCQQVYAVTHNQGDVTFLLPSDGSEISTITPTSGGLAGFGPAFISDCRLYVGGNSSSRVITLDGEEGTIGVAATVGYRGDMRRSDYASGREILVTAGIAGKRYSYDLERSATLEASYLRPISNAITQWCGGIDEFSSGGVICGWGQTSRSYCAGYDRDPSSGTDVTANWYYPTPATAPQRTNCLRRIVSGATDTFAAGMTYPNGVSTADQSLFYSLVIFSANVSSFGTVGSQIRLHRAPFSDNENEAATEQEQFVAPLDVLPVPDGDGDFYVLSGPALDDGVGYCWWRITSAGALVWRHAETGLAPYLSGNAAVDPGTGDLISAWTDTGAADQTQADYGVLRLAADDGDLVWKVTLGTTNLGGLSQNRIQGIAAGRVQ